MSRYFEFLIIFSVGDDDTATTDEKWRRRKIRSPRKDLLRGMFCMDLEEKETQEASTEDVKRAKGGAYDVRSNSKKGLTTILSSRLQINN
mmetsp:Transcript_37341/g.67151  ORF Transcript_37341/g.67151 Transcript_37341/m.67151 type:complete len:90 (+) Transcript_37341:611-880(+)